MERKLIQLSDVITDIAAGPFGSNLKVSCFVNDGFPIIDGANLKSFKVTDNITKFVTEEKARSLHRSIAKRGDIVVTISGTLGQIAYIPDDSNYEEYLCSQRQFRVTFDTTKVYVPYLVFYFHTYEGKHKILSFANQVGVPALSQPLKNFRQISVQLPTLETQKKIASIVESINGKIEQNEIINNNLEQQAQAIYQQMFIDNARSDWAEGTLSDIADITMGQSPSGSSYNEDGTGTIFFQGRAEFGFRFPSVRLYTTEPKRMARSNDTLMSVRAPVGDLNVAHMDCCIGRGLAAIHSKSHHQSFVLYTMFSLKKQLDVFNGEGTVFGSINRNSLNDMPILIPSDDILDEFERIVAPMDLTIRNNYDENCRLQDIRDTLLPRLMSSELDVSDIDI
ncbi:type I restriction enzyme S subunit [Muricomes intestini]|uniref:Type I restriction enzyme S subunit n=2 Tax=Bacteria TaxID=2 RepID=A0A4R3K8C7_9FIRM|nr:restriction endonuclease subunit S [Muricomes intestini]TCS78901.1 type I restriction enzyme S subunit [Muricomes intestini]